MPEDLARVAVGLPVAALWPLTIPSLASSRLRVGVTATFSALYILAPLIPSVSSITLLLVTAAVAIGLSSPVAGGEDSCPGNTWRTKAKASAPILAALLLGLAAVASTDFERGHDAVLAAVESNRAALAGTGLIACVFLGGSVVAWILKPFTRALGKSGEASKLPGLDNAGRYIGWFERAVLFAFVIGGEPEAAAVALAAKSFARFPTLSEHHEGFAEYFLIGSLASLTVAVAVAAATRAALRIGPF
jgi:hypothetical protein